MVKVRFYDMLQPGKWVEQTYETADIAREMCDKGAEYDLIGIIM